MHYKSFAEETTIHQFQKERIHRKIIMSKNISTFDFLNFLYEL